MPERGGVARVTAAISAPFVALGAGVALLLSSTPGGQLPTLMQWAGFVGVLLAMLFGAGAVIPHIGGGE